MQSFKNGYIQSISEFINFWKMFGKFIGGVSIGRTIKIDIFYLLVREHRQKLLPGLNKFWALRGWGFLGESVKKGEFMTKISF